MVVAEQMQDTVDEQRLHFFTKRMATALCLASRSLNRDDDIAKQMWLWLVSEREREDVSRFVFLAILMIQGVDLRVCHQRETEFRLWLL